MKLLKEPLVHFLLIGATLFALASWRAKQRPAGNAAPRIEVTAEVIERLRAGYQRQFGQPPDEDELRGLVMAHIREEVLYREALAIGLDRDDTIVRRRMAQKMEFLTDDISGAAEPDEAALRRFFADNAARYAQPAHVSFRHIYFSQEKRGADVDAAAREALAALGKGASEDTLGDAFLHGFEFALQDPRDVAALFGSEFADRLPAAREAEWVGPVASTYGLHLVRIEGRGTASPVHFETVREAVLRDFHDERRRTANRQVFERLRARYSVAVDEAALSKVTAPPAKTAKQ